MGADIYLRSVFTDEVASAAVARANTGVATDKDPFAYVDRCCAEYLATGGYFRDAYNHTALLPALGLRWTVDVAPLLGEDDELPIPAARHLLAELERRPITPAMVDAICNGHVKPEPFVASIERHMKAAGVEVIEAEPRTDDERAILTDHMIERRHMLMALLRRSIELNELLLVSL